jgi:hypothetical protein
MTTYETTTHNTTTDKTTSPLFTGRSGIGVSQQRKVFRSGNQRSRSSLA